MYNVTVDRNAMRQEVLGPLFQRHVVSLAGTVDARWLESYAEVARDSDSFKRYVLEPGKGLDLLHLPRERRAQGRRDAFSSASRSSWK